MSQQEFKTRYPDYNVLDKWRSPSWNEQTRKVVAQRLDEVPGRRFFNEREWIVLESICSRLIPQPERPYHPVPITPWIDQKLHEHKGEGYRYHDMPPMEDAWRKGLNGIDEDSKARFGRGFVELTQSEQDELLTAVQKGETQSPCWAGMNVKRFFTSTLLKEVFAIYYAHPEAWSEIGFGGPASPRGYVRTGLGRSDPWDGKESPRPEPRR